MIRRDIFRMICLVFFCAAAISTRAGNSTYSSHSTNRRQRSSLIGHRSLIRSSSIHRSPILRSSFLRSPIVSAPVSGPERSSPHFDFTPACREAYNELIRLRIETAKQEIAAEKKHDPGNLVPFFLENYADFFVLFFNEDPAEYAKRKPALDLRLAQMKTGPGSDPYTLFTRSIIYFQWAAVEVKFGDHWAAAWSFRRAFLAGKENLAKFPDFAPSLMLQGTLEAAAGTIPPGYKWLSGLLGIKGTLAGGMSMLQKVIGQNTPEAKLFHDEAVFYYCYLRCYIMNDKEGVFAFIHNQRLDTRSNYLFAYLAANLSRNNHQASNAVAVIHDRDDTPGYLDLPIWDMELGYSLADHLDPQAIPVLERFLSRFRGKFYVKETLQKLGWMYYLTGQQQKADLTRERLKGEGNQESEADKQAMKEAISGHWPQPLLLKARLLDDGGYFSESLALLRGQTSTSFVDPADQLEFTYRIGRLYDALNRKDEAIAAYANAIRLGSTRKEHYAARAALQTGIIFEERGDKKTAMAWYHKVLEMKNHEYKNSLDQKARAGLVRCGEEGDN